MSTSRSTPRSSAGARRPRTAAHAGAEPQASEPRGARRKRETREKLLRAAFDLIAARGVDDVAINEITDAADVGFGSFYNHFSSKEAIYEEVVHAMFEAYGSALDGLTHDIEDPAEVIAICIRHTIARARHEPLWGRFLVRDAFSPEAIRRGLGARLYRDIEIGNARKRFTVPDPLMAALLAGGTVIATVAAEAAASATDDNLLAESQLDMAKLGDRAATTVLSALGLQRDAAAKLASKPLVPRAWPPLFAP